MNPPLGIHPIFEWYVTQIGIAALSKELNSIELEDICENAIREGLEIGLELTKEEKEIHTSTKGIVILFYS